MVSERRSCFKAETLFLDCNDARELVRSQWPMSPRMWTAYRLIMALYITIMFVVMFAEKFSRYQWKVLIAFTHWCYFLLTLCFILKFLSLIKYYRWLAIDDEIDEFSSLTKRQFSWTLLDVKSPLLLRINWLVSNVALVMAFYITCDYYVRGHGGVSNPANKMIDVQIHGVNAVLAGIEILMCGTPFYLLHVYQPLMLLSAYEAFTAVYYVAGGTSKSGSPALYPWMDWRRPTDVIILSFIYSGLAVTFAHTVLWLAVKGRQRIGCYLRQERQKKQMYALLSEGLKLNDK